MLTASTFMDVAWQPSDQTKDVLLHTALCDFHCDEMKSSHYKIRITFFGSAVFMFHFWQPKKNLWAGMSLTGLPGTCLVGGGM